MHRIASLATLTIVFMLVLGGPCRAEDPPFVWITDPAELEARGYGRNAPPVRRLIPVEDHRPLAERIAEREAEERTRAAASDVGGRAVRWAAVQGTDFRFLNELATYNAANFEIYPLPSSPNRFADAPITLRDDRRIRFLDVWTTDFHPDHSVDVDLIETCHPSFGAGSPVITELATVVGGNFSGGNRFDFVVVPGNVYVDNALCTYFIRARFSNVAGDANVRLLKVRVVWAP